MNTIPLPSSLRKEIQHPLVLDGLIVLALLVLAWFTYFVTPQYAANLPQDGIDFAMPAVNLLEHGRLAVSAYGHDFPPAHSFGMPWLLLPAYVIFGHFPGNGIYSIFFCALGSIAAAYFIGAKLGGRFCGCLASLFLITHYGFWQYSQKIMSEVPSAFLGAALLLVLLTMRERKRPGSASLLAGATLGLAMVIRNDNILFLAPAVWLLWENTAATRWRCAGFFLAGMVPFIVGLAVYNQATFGSPLLSGYQYRGNAGTTNQPLFSVKYATKTGFMHFRGIDPQFAWLIDGNGALYGKSLLSEADTSRIFGDPHYWQMSGRRLYQALTAARTGLGLVGLLACLIGWRAKPARRQFFLWAIISFSVYFLFYVFYMWQEERYFLRLAPLFCVANAVGVSALLSWWPGKLARVAALVLVGALVVALGVFNMRTGFPSGDDPYVYDALTRAARWMETNAVVVSNFEPAHVDAYVIRGTGRAAVPLNRWCATTVFAGRNLVRTPLYPFLPAEEPERLRELLREGRTVYWLINSPWTGSPSAELETLRQKFHLQVLATANPDGSGEHPFFGRIEELPVTR